jgi:hypothetical protein
VEVSGRGLFSVTIRDSIHDNFENLHQDIRTSSPESNPRPPQYEAGIPTFEIVILVCSLLPVCLCERKIIDSVLHSFKIVL